MSQTTSQQRGSWKHFECNPDAMIVVNFGPDKIRVAPPAADAFKALASVLQANGYQIRVDDTDSYNCRTIKGGAGRSLHSYGIAVDVNWDTNPFKETPDNRAVQFSDKPTQNERGHDVKLGRADTDMTEEMIEDVRAIKTKGGKTVFEWGGGWKDRKDAMHFEIDTTPEDLAAGIDWNTVKQASSSRAIEQVSDLSIDTPSHATAGVSEGNVTELQTVLAREGFYVGTIDGIYGPFTAQAVRAFQASRGLPQTGMTDDSTLRALFTPTSLAPRMEGTAMKPEDLLRTIFGALIGGQATAPPPPAATPTSPAQTQEVLQAVLAALAGKQPSIAVLPAPPGGVSTPVTTPILSPIDNALGGEILTGKKTALAILAYVVLAIFQAMGVAGTATGADATTTGQILTTLIAAFGGLGLTSKVDRVVQMLSLIAGNPVK